MVEAKVSRWGAWLAAPGPGDPLPRSEVPAVYSMWRKRVFIGIFVGYAAFYLIRNNVPLVATLLLSEGQLDKVQIGLIANAVLVAYGLSKFVMATISDRSNARYFMPLGLALSALTNIALAAIPAATATVGAFAITMFVNGWFQGMGWPSCGRVLIHWFSTGERGWKGAVWNIAHNLGGMAVGAAVAFALSVTGNQWRSAFWFPALIALLAAVVGFLVIRDTPMSMGLPPIEDYRNDPAKVEVDAASEAGMSYLQIVVKHVFLNRTMVLLALANVPAYALRYGVLSWAPTYLAEVHGTSVAAGIAGFSVFELAGIVGVLTCGWVSDRVFGGNRTKTGVASMVGVAVALVGYWLAPAGAPYWLLLSLLFLIGAFIYGPVMLIGLQALDMSARHVAGTAAGFTGLLGYVVGATMASTGVGWLIQQFGWGAAFGVLTALVIAGIMLLAMVGPEEARLLAAHRDSLGQSSVQYEVAAD